MNNAQRSVIAIAAASLVVGYSILSQNATLNHLYERFPDLDKKVAKRTYKKILREATAGKTNFHNWSEATFDDYFLIEYTMMLTNMYQ